MAEYARKGLLTLTISAVAAVVTVAAGSSATGASIAPAGELGRPVHGFFVVAAVLVLIGAGALFFLRQTRSAARRLREREERLRLILASTEEGIFGMDPDGRCTFANRAAVSGLGYDDEADLLGRDIHELIHHTRPDGSPHSAGKCPATLAIAEGRSVRLADETLWRADGTAFPAEYRTRPMHCDGRIVGAVVSFVDISERREREVELARAQKMEMLGRLTGGIAHDFDDLLTVIRSNLGLLKTRLPRADTESDELTHQAIEKTEEATALSQQLLAFSREEALSPETIDLGVFLRDNRRFFQRLAGDDVEITLDTDTGALPVFLDPRQLQNALRLLVRNARDAMPGGGGLRIAAKADRVDTDSGLDVAAECCVTVAVSDIGAGMSAEVLARAVEPFFTTGGPGKGSGLGLSMVYGFARQSGGDLRLASEPGNGTTVTLYFPVAAAAALA